MEITLIYKRADLKKMDFVKRRTTMKHVTRCENFDSLKEQYLLDIKAVAEMESIPDSLIIKWDRIGINYVPVSEWSMAKAGSKRVEVTGLKDKRQITAVFAGSRSGDFLPVQLSHTSVLFFSVGVVTLLLSKFLV